MEPGGSIFVVSFKPPPMEVVIGDSGLCPKRAHVRYFLLFVTSK